MTNDQKHTVLLVDDELYILRAAEFKLKKVGYQVICARDGEEAWELIQQQLPDIVVTDLQMPRLTGIELVSRIRECPETASLPVLMLTAKGFEISKAETKSQLQLIDIFSKPFSPRDLCERVRQALEDVPADTLGVAAQAESAT